MNEKNQKVMTHVSARKELERRTSFNRVIIKLFSFFLLFLEVSKTSSVKNAFLIGEINFEKKFNTFENDTHERQREMSRAKKNKRDEIQLKTRVEEEESRTIV